MICDIPHDHRLPFVVLPLRGRSIRNIVRVAGGESFQPRRSFAKQRRLSPLNITQIPWDWSPALGANLEQNRNLMDCGILGFKAKNRPTG
jgi:hypothetical protein